MLINPESKVAEKTIEQENYELLQQLVPSLMNGAKRFKLESPDFMDLHFKWNVKGKEIRMAQFFIKNSSIVRVPEILFHIDLKRQYIEPISFRHDEISRSKKTLENTVEKNEVSKLLNGWLRVSIERDYKVTHEDFIECSSDNGEGQDEEEELEL